MLNIAQKYGLDLDGEWNKELMQHLARHPNKYHNFVFNAMEKASKEAGNNKTLFLNLFDKYVKSPIMRNPKLLRKSGW
jgi:hypothetical protein